MASRRKQDEQTIQKAQRILERWFVRESEPITSAWDAADFIKMKIAAIDHEVFAVLFLDVGHRTIAFEILFHGTINYAVVYPREVARAALRHNAHAVMLAHNHPSGNATPSIADRILTDRIREALATIEINLLDHLVIGGGNWTSMIEHERELAAAKRNKRRARKAA